MPDSVPEYHFEHELEDYLAENPDALEEGLVLIGRQLSISAGVIDLLGIDSGAKLVVIELKRKDVSREAVAQALDYAAALFHDDVGDLITAIEDNDGGDGIEYIPRFEQWYLHRFDAEDIYDLWPVRLILAGNSIDDSAKRISTFLQDGYDLSVKTKAFNRWIDGGKIKFSPIDTLPPQPSPRGGARGSGSVVVNRVVKALPSWESFSDARDLIRASLSNTRYGNNVDDGEGNTLGYAITAPVAVDNELRWRWAFTLRAYRENPQQIAITIFPNCIHLASDLVADMEEEIPSMRYTEGSFDRTHGDYYIYFRFENVSEWHRHRPKVKAAIKEIGRQWYRNM